MTARFQRRLRLKKLNSRGALRMYEDMVSIKFGDNVVYIHQTTDRLPRLHQQVEGVEGRSCRRLFGNNRSARSGGA